MSSVVATTPFLTAEQAAEQLGTSPLNIKRLAAKGQLKAHYGSGEKVTFRVLPADLERCLLSQPEFFDLPSMRDGWIFDTSTNRRRDRFKGDAQRALVQYVESLEQAPRNKNGYVMRVDNPQAGVVYSAIKGQEFKPSSLERDKPRGENTLEEYAIAELRRYVVGIIDREYKEIDSLNPKSNAEILFETKEKYEEITQRGWNFFLNQPVAITTQTFPEVTMANGTLVPITFTVRNAVLSLLRSDITRKAF